MRRASITIPDGLESALQKYRRDLGAPPSLASVMRSALGEYLKERGYPVEAGEILEEEEIIFPTDPKPRGLIDAPGPKGGGNPGYGGGSRP